MYKLRLTIFYISFLLSSKAWGTHGQKNAWTVLVRDHKERGCSADLEVEVRII
jgi:hypothetical protein